MSLASQVNLLAARVAVEVKALRNRLVSTGPGLYGGGNLTADRTLRAHPSLLPELWTDWTSKSDGATPSTGDEGRAITLATGGAGVPVLAVASGGLTLATASGAAYLVQTTSASRKIRRIGATWKFLSNATGDEAMALCAFTSTTLSPLQASIHVVMSTTGWALQVYDSGATTIKNGNFVPALSKDVELRAEIVLINDTLYAALPDGTYAQGSHAKVASLTGIAATWEIVQGTVASSVRIMRTWADDLPDRVGAPSEPRVGQIAQHAFPNLYYDATTSHFAINAAPTALADWFVAGTSAAYNEIIVNAPTDISHATRKDYVDTQVATRAPASVAPRTATATATYSADGTVSGNIALTCTGDTVITPTGTPSTDRMMLVECLASGAARTVSVAASVVMVGVTSRSLILSAAGKAGLFGLRYSALRGAWELIAAGLEA